MDDRPVNFWEAMMTSLVSIQIYGRGMSTWKEGANQADILC